MRPMNNRTSTAAFVGIAINTPSLKSEPLATCLGFVMVGKISRRVRDRESVSRYGIRAPIPICQAQDDQRTVEARAAIRVLDKRV